MSKTTPSQLLAQAARTLYQRAPKRVRRSVRNVVMQALPTSMKQDAATAQEKRTNKLSQDATKIRMSAQDIGTTYEEALVLPMLALENNALHSLLYKANQDNMILRDRLEATKQRHQTDQTDSSAAILAEEYLAGQPSGTPRHLVLANEYPRLGREYGNGFVHQRVKQYLSAGIAVDVVCAGYSVEQDLFEYDGVRVLTGHGQEISEVLKRQEYTSASVHFLNQRIWNGLEPFLADLDVHIFLHGYECSRWVRRLSNYQSGRDLERAIDRSINLQNFWHDVLHHPHQAKAYIFVSDWWRRAVYDDMRLTFPKNKVHVVHNFINPDLFTYVPKNDDQRFNILWVRSAANRNYANDIAIKTLERLAVSEYWSQCKVTIIGDGRYFPEFDKKLGKFSNVRIQQGYISQDEIAQLHKTHGIFLVPTRLDSQGVSRDEAMSSGLVPATNLVAAVPEFVDSNSGIVAGPEDAEELAAGILRVWEDPDLFQRLSKAAAHRVRNQSGRESTIEREIRILGIEG